MDLSNYLLMKHELSLVAVFFIVLIYDLFASGNAKKYFFPISCCLFLIHTVLGFFYHDNASAFGGMFIAGPAQEMVKNILNVGLILIYLQAKTWLSSDESRVKQGEFFMLTMLTLFGMYLMISSGNFLLFYIGLETASLPMVALIAFDKYRHESSEAGAKFIFNAIFSSAIMLFGVSLLYGACGTLYFSDLGNAVTSTPLTIMSMIFVLSGLFFKISLVPFHGWAPDTYQGAPTTVTLYLSTISKGAAVFALTVILYKVFPVLFPTWQGILWVVSLVTITVGNLFALRQNNMKRFLAYSSISQAGYIMLSLYSGTAQGMAAAIFYIFVYIFSNAAAFGVITAIENKTGKVNMSDYNNLYKTNPRLAIVMTFAMFSLGGMPPFAGFFSKMFIFMAAIQQMNTLSILLVVFAFLNTIVSLYYYLLVVKAMFLRPNNQPIESFRTESYLKTSVVLSVVGIVVIGLLSFFYENISLVSFGF
ncbi:MAG: NADH-quinone oxidoreductase subunit N [Dysgonamonadaceae bacterium]